MRVEEIIKQKKYVPLNLHSARFYSSAILSIVEGFLNVAHIMCSTFFLPYRKKCFQPGSNRICVFSFSSCDEVVGSHLVVIKSTKRSASPLTKSSDYHSSVILRSQCSLITLSHPTISFFIPALKTDCWGCVIHWVMAGREN